MYWQLERDFEIPLAKDCRPNKKEEGLFPLLRNAKERWACAEWLA